MASVDRLKGASLHGHPLSRSVIATIRDRGYDEATVEEFVERAGMSRADFDCQFEGKEEIVTLVIEAEIEHFVTRISHAYDELEGWPANLRAAAYETARYVRDNPDMSWLAIIGVMRERETARAHRDRVFQWASGMVDAGRAAAPEPDAVPASAPLIAVGGIMDVLRRYHEGGDVRANEALPQMMYAAVRPYLGEAAARIELEIELPADLRSL
jgi:AcrR family transcriptional regulator